MPEGKRSPRAAARTVADLMRRNPVTVAADATLREVIRLLLHHGIRGCPVTERGGKLVGTVSVTDLLWLSEELVPVAPDSPRWSARARAALDERTVRDIMTPDAFGIGADRDVAELSAFFSKTGLHRALVLEEGELVGIVSISDLLELVVAAERA
jgi:CBS domain-containing protein